MNSRTALSDVLTEAGTERQAAAGPRWKIWLAAALYLGISLFIQWRANAPAAAFGTYPDEPAHYIGGLLMRDYAVSGVSQSPISFAQAYYANLPYFALGFWPPFYYCTEGIWVLFFGPGRPAVLFLSALFATASASMILYAVCCEAGWLAGFCGGLLFLGSPEIQRQICTVMVDLPVTAGVLAATLFASRYLTWARWRDSIAFSVFAAIAFLTKYSGAYACGLPLLGILVLRRWTLLRRANFWIQPAIVIALVSPWVFLTARYGLQLIQLDFVGLPEEHRYPMAVRLGLFVKAFACTMTWPIWIVVGVGLATWLFRRSRRSMTGIMFLLHFAALLAFLTASSVLNERRYFTPGIAALLIAGLVGWKWLVDWLPRYWSPIALVACAAVNFGLGARVDPNLRVNDLRPVVDHVVAEPRWRNAAIVVSTDAEGPMIAEFAVRDPHRPGYRLIRPGKVLAQDNWYGGNYKSLFDTPEQVQSVLADLHVQLVILKADPNYSTKRHEILLRDAVAGRPDSWRRVVFHDTATSKYAIFETLRAAH